MGKIIGSLTGANSAKRVLVSQSRALEEQTKQAQANAAEAARQAAIQATQAQQREAATREVEAMQQADANASKAPEVNTGAASADTSTTRKRARFQSAGNTSQSVSI